MMLMITKTTIIFKNIIFQAVGYLKINSNDLQLYEVGTTIVLILEW